MSQAVRDALSDAGSDAGALAFLASPAPDAQVALGRLVARYGQHDPDNASAIVALGGDGFMLKTLHGFGRIGVPVYGMNRGTVGFLMNAYREDGLLARLRAAEQAIIHPLKMVAWGIDGTRTEALAINEVALLRAGPQASKLRISVDGKVRLGELVCDGCLVATPAGSTAYNCSAHGPIVPIGSQVLALTAVAAFRPRRWRGALLPACASVRFDVLEPQRRPVRADTDLGSIDSVVAVEVRLEPAIVHRLLFDPGHGLEERLLREQFT